MPGWFDKCGPSCSFFHIGDPVDQYKDQETDSVAYHAPAWSCMYLGNNEPVSEDESQRNAECTDHRK